MSNSKHTALYPLHHALNAKLVDFAGYSMPLQYGAGIISEHLHCRELCGFFDISHMGQCLIYGDDAASKLEQLVPSAIDTLKPGQQRYSVLTNDQGGIIDDIVISRLSGHYLVVVNAACKERDFSYLQRHFGENFHSLPDQALLALQGPQAFSVMRQLIPEAGQLRFMHCRQCLINDISCIISRSGYTGEDGFEISVSNHDAEALARLLLSFEQVQPIGLGARDSLRLEAGLSLYGHELSERISPVEAGLRWLIGKNSHHFPGAKIIHEQLRQGAPRKRVGLLIEGKQPVREHYDVYDSADDKIGFITSGGYSPNLKKPIALALIDSRCNESRLFTKIRNKTITMQITTTPFVPHRYYRG